MKGMVLFLLILVILSLFSFMAVSLSNDKKNLKENSKNFEFKTFTSAVCETKNNLNYCRDELFVNCNGKISKSSEIKECNGFKIDNKVTGFAVLNLVS